MICVISRYDYGSDVICTVAQIKGYCGNCAKQMRLQSRLHHNGISIGTCHQLPLGVLIVMYHCQAYLTGGLTSNRQLLNISLRIITIFRQHMVTSCLVTSNLLHGDNTVIQQRRWKETIIICSSLYNINDL